MHCFKSCSIIFCLLLSFLAEAQNPSKDQDKYQVDSLLRIAVKIMNSSASLANEKMTFVVDASQKKGWLKEEAYGQMYLGISHFYLGNYPEALDTYLKSKVLFDSLGLVEGQAKVNNELGVFFSRQENYEEAYQYYEAARKIAEQNNLYQELAVSFSNQGQSFFKRGLYDESFPLMTKALEIKKSIADSVGMGYELKRLGTYYFVKKDFEKGLSLLEQSNVIRQLLGDKKGLAINVVTIAEMYQQRALYKKAIATYEKTLELSNDIGFVDLTRYVYSMLEQCYLKIADYKKAYHNQKMSQLLSDSLLNESKVEAITELQVKYETTQKEQEIATQKLEITAKESAIKSQRFQIYGLISGLVILLLAGFIFYNQYKNQQKQKLQAASCHFARKRTWL